MKEQLKCRRFMPHQSKSDTLQISLRISFIDQAPAFFVPFREQMKTASLNIWGAFQSKGVARAQCFACHLFGIYAKYWPNVQRIKFHISLVQGSLTRNQIRPRPLQTDTYNVRYLCDFSFDKCESFHDSIDIVKQNQVFQ